MNFDPPEPEGPASRANPFPGLRAFEADDGHLFFGREGQSEDILRSLRRSRLLAVVGASGSGKSSLVRAGLLPYLHGGFLEEAGSRWRVAIFRPGGQPIGALAYSLVDQSVLDAKPADPEAVHRCTQLMTAQLRRSGLGLIEATRLAHLSPGENVLIVVDQFEELFRFGDAAGAAPASDDSAAFVKLILEATWQDKLPIYVCLTMRSDFIGECARFRDLPEAVTAGLYLIPRMTRANRRAAIEEPVRVAGGHITPRLVTRILNDVGDDPDQLPIMQHALMRAWDYWQAGGDPARPIDLSDYEAIGGTAGALSMHADEAFVSLNDDGRTIARKMFQCLTEKDADNREARRPTSLSILAEVAEAPFDEVAKIVETFRAPGRSFLMPPTPLEPATVIDISHESLIRGWKRLREWVEQESESARVYKRLSDTAVLHAAGNAGLWRDPDLAVALAWRGREQPNEAWSRRYRGRWPEATAFLEDSRNARDAEARTARLRHRIVAAAAIVFLIVAGAAIWEGMKAQKSATEATAQRDRAEQQTKLAEAQTQRAETSAREALASTEEANRQRDRAEEQTRIARHQQAIAEEALKFTVADAIHFAAVLALVGKFDEALSELDGMDDLISEYNSKYPNDHVWLAEIAKIKNEAAGVLLYKPNQEIAALERFRQSRELFSRLVRSEPKSAQSRADFLDVCRRIAEVLVKLNRRQEALDELFAAKKAETELPANVSRDPKLRYQLAKIDLSLGDELLAAKRTDEAQGAFEEGRALLAGLVAQDQKNASWMEQLAASDRRVGDALARKEQFSQAMAMYADQLKVFSLLASLDVKQANYASGGIDTNFKIGATWSALGKPDQALTAYGDSLEMIAVASGKWPDNPYWNLAYVFAQKKAGEILESQGKTADALTAYQHARDRQKGLLSAAPSDQLKVDLVSIDDHVGDLLVKLDRLDDALVVRKEALNESTAILAAAPNDRARQDDLAVSYTAVGNVLLLQKQYDEAIANHREALKLRRSLLETEPANERWRLGEFILLQAMGDALVEKGDDEEALALYRESLDSAVKLIALDAVDAKSFRKAAVANSKIGALLWKRSDKDGAATAYQAALDFQERVVRLHPDDIAGRGVLSWTYGMAGVVLMSQSKLIESSRAFGKCFSIAKEALRDDPVTAQSWTWLSAFAQNLGGLSYDLILAKMFQQALEDAELALSIAPAEVFIEGNRAHSLMFLGRIDEARSIYFGHRGEQVNGKLWEKATLDDFEDLRKAGLSSPLMDEVQEAFAMKL